MSLRSINEENELEFIWVGCHCILHVRARAPLSERLALPAVPGPPRPQRQRPRPPAHVVVFWASVQPLQSRVGEEEEGEGVFSCPVSVAVTQ